MGRRVSSETPARPSWLSRHRTLLAPYLFIAPNVVVITVFMFVPIVFAFVMSTTEWSLIGTPRFTGVENYRNLVADRQFWQSLGHTIVYTLGTVPVSIALGLLVAVLLNRRLPGRTLLRSVYFVPVIISLVAVGMIAVWMFNDNYGVINEMLGAFGLPGVSWLSSSTWAMPSLILTTLWIRLGFNMVVYLAALQSIPIELYQAAQVDGAGTWRLFRHITWPLLAPTTFLLVIINVIYSLHAFDLVYVMTGGGPGFSTTVLVQYVYELAFETGQMGYASAVGVVLYLMLMAFTIFQWRFTKQASST